MTQPKSPSTLAIGELNRALTSVFLSSYIYMIYICSELVEMPTIAAFVTLAKLTLVCYCSSQVCSAPPSILLTPLATRTLLETMDQRSVTWRILTLHVASRNTGTAPTLKEVSASFHELIFECLCD
jgi:hypothetical protein